MTETNFMSWNANKICTALTFALWFSIACKGANAMQFDCPVIKDTQPGYFQIFDGPPADKISLMAESGDSVHGFWSKLSYVYDKGREINIQCAYLDGQTRKFIIEKRIDFCSYEVDSTNYAHVSCR